jgi:hypothetical protein
MGLVLDIMAASGQSADKIRNLTGSQCADQTTRLGFVFHSAASGRRQHRQRNGSAAAPCLHFDEMCAKYFVAM